MFLQWLIFSWGDYLRPHIFSVQAHPSFKSSKLAETETHTHTHKCMVVKALNAILILCCSEEQIRGLCDVQRIFQTLFLFSLSPSAYLHYFFLLFVLLVIDPSLSSAPWLLLPPWLIMLLQTSRKKNENNWRLSSQSYCKANLEGAAIVDGK